MSVNYNLKNTRAFISFDTIELHVLVFLISEICINFGIEYEFSFSIKLMHLRYIEASVQSQWEAIEIIGFQ